MKKLKKKKAIVLSIGLAALMLTANNLNAQGVFGNMLDNYYEEKDQQSNSRSLLGRNGNSNGGMEWENGGMTTQDPSVPVGNGLMLLVAAGVSYAMAKSKNGKGEPR